MSGNGNILNGGSGKLDEGKLMAYLEGRLTPGEQHEVELWLAEEGMESDALEGLKMAEAAKVKDTVNKMHHRLDQSLGQKKRKRRPMKTEQYTLVAIALILLLAIVAFFVIKQGLK